MTGTCAYIYSWVCDPFVADVNAVTDLPVTEIDQLIERSHSTVNKVKHKSVGLVDFWMEMRRSVYAELYNTALRRVVSDKANHQVKRTAVS